MMIELLLTSIISNENPDYARVIRIRCRRIQVWNCLSLEVTSAPSLATFRTRLETFLSWHHWA